MEDRKRSILDRSERDASFPDRFSLARFWDIASR